jgi:hypothetical protein
MNGRTPWSLPVTISAAVLVAACTPTASPAPLVKTNLWHWPPRARLVPTEDVFTNEFIPK